MAKARPPFCGKPQKGILSDGTDSIISAKNVHGFPPSHPPFAVFFHPAGDESICVLTYGQLNKRQSAASILRQIDHFLSDIT